MLFWLFEAFVRTFASEGCSKFDTPRACQALSEGMDHFLWSLHVICLILMRLPRPPVMWLEAPVVAGAGGGPRVLRERQGKKTKECRHYFGVKTPPLLHIQLLFEGKCFIKQVQGFTVDIRECVNHVRNIRCGTTVCSGPRCLFDMSSKHPKFKDFLKCSTYWNVLIKCKCMCPWRIMLPLWRKNEEKMAFQILSLCYEVFMTCFSTRSLAKSYSNG